MKKIILVIFLATPVYAGEPFQDHYREALCLSNPSACLTDDQRQIQQLQKNQRKLQNQLIYQEQRERLRQQEGYRQERRRLYGCSNTNRQYGMLCQ